MSEHAETIRSYLANTLPPQHVAVGLRSASPYQARQALDALVAENKRLREALEAVVEERCECGGEFKTDTRTWQTRCASCGAHREYGYGAAVRIARAALAGEAKDV